MQRVLWLLVTLFLLGCAEPGSRSTVLESDGAALPGSGADAGRTVLYRDTWGVRHIYASSIAAGLYAQGWAQAEDRPEQLLLNLKMGMGELASVVGEAGVQTDLRSHLWCRELDGGDG